MRKHTHAQMTKGERTTGEEILPMKNGSKKIKATIYTRVCVIRLPRIHDSDIKI